MRKEIGLFLLLLLLLPGCRPDDPEVALTLPAETREGKNTIGFLLNGKVWVNQGRDCSFSSGCRESLESSSYPHGGGRTFSLQALQASRRDQKPAVLQYLSITLDTIKGPGVYLIDGTRLNADLYFRDALRQESDYYGVDSTKTPFTLHVTTIDTVANIIAGRFEGILYDDVNKQDSIIIREGRFDVKTDQ